ncbi:serpin family protein [Sorangium sp. So ce1099]
MEVAFEPSADFSGILSGGEIQIEDVIHKAVIDVDERERRRRRPRSP